MIAKIPPGLPVTAGLERVFHADFMLDFWIVWLWLLGTRKCRSDKNNRRLNGVLEASTEHDAKSLDFALFPGSKPPKRLPGRCALERSDGAPKSIDQA